MRTAALAILVAALSARAAEEGEAPPTLSIVDPRVLTCTPATLKSGQSLTLTLGPYHGKELAVQGPGKAQIYFLVVTDPPKGDPQLMSTKEFKAAKTVVIPPDYSARPWIANGGIEKVFSTPGTYRIMVSEVLESEVGGHVCNVRYAG
jgi:hypothetical protein